MGSLRGRIRLTVIVDFRFGRPGDRRAGILPGRPVGRQLARWSGSDGRVWRLNCAHCGGHCTKTADARLEIMKLESLNLGNRSESLWLTVLCPASTLIRWHFWPLDGGDFGRLFFFWHWIFDAPFEKHSKGGVILSRSSQSWENLKFDTMLTLVVKIRKPIYIGLCFRLPTPGGASVKIKCQCVRRRGSSW